MQRLPTPLTPVAFVIGSLYETLIRAHNAVYSANWITRRRLSNPVISIGNLTMGGAGKTPLVIYLVQYLLKLGFVPAVLTRGYGRRPIGRWYILPPETDHSSDARILGDEPALIRRHLPSIWMGISKNRYRAGYAIAQKCPEVIFVLDDGFQHQILHRDLDIVIIDPSQPLRSNQVFPRGTLREPLEGLRRCHVAIINAPPENEAGNIAEAQVRDVNPHAKIFRCRQFILKLIPFSSWQNRADCRNGAVGIRSVYLVASVGNPERFRRDVMEIGIEVRGWRYYRDHYRLGTKDWKVCTDAAHRCGADAILTTEKDAVKIFRPPDFPLLVSIQSTEMYDEKSFEYILRNCVGGLS